jgi:CheY-like chemotaxis protein
MTKNPPQRVLIIEDDADSAESLKMLLEFNECSVKVAADGERGLAAARDFKPRVIICDIGLPGSINGLEIARIIRADDTLHPIHLIALSGYGQSEDIKETQNAGFHHHLVKPADFDKLINLIEQIQ